MVAMSHFENIIKMTGLFREGKIERKKLWDQKLLQTVVGSRDGKYHKNIFILPPEYLCIFDNTGCSRQSWVISHWQAARKMKHKIGKS